MRAFFALQPNVDTALAIERWRALCWPHLPGAVPVANYHVTLAFLGEITTPKIERLHALADQISVPAFDLSLDRLGFWPKPGILWLGSSCVPEELEMLERKLSSAAAQLGIKNQHAEFKPHITLKRRLREAPAGPLVDPEFSIRCNEFHLMESLGQRSGVRYESRLGWTLDDGQ